jgi:hypothetical protein
VQAADLGVAEGCALLGVPVDLLDLGVHVEERQLLGAGQQRSVRGQRRGEPPTHRLQLPDVPVGERPQERAQRGRCPHVVKQPIHAAVAQHVQVIDRVRAGEHPGHDRGDLHRGVRRPHRQTGGGELGQTALLGQPQRRNQPGMGDQIRIGQRRGHRRRGMRRSHSADALSMREMWTFDKPHSPSSEGICATKPSNHSE